MILLDDLDRELERRRHSYCRYADDCNIYVSSRRAGERVLQSITKFVERKLKLKVNQTKSAVDRPWKRRFLGFSFTHHRRPRIRIPQETLKTVRQKLKVLFRQGRGRNLSRFTREDLDGWLRRRLRCILWRQWKRGRTRNKQLRRRGMDEKRARASTFNGRGAWWNSGASHMNDTFRKSYFDKLGLFSLLDKLLSSRMITT